MDFPRLFPHSKCKPPAREARSLAEELSRTRQRINEFDFYRDMLLDFVVEVSRPPLRPALITGPKPGPPR